MIAIPLRSIAVEYMKPIAYGCAAEIGFISGNAMEAAETSF